MAEKGSDNMRRRMNKAGRRLTRRTGSSKLTPSARAKRLAELRKSKPMPKPPQRRKVTPRTRPAEMSEETKREIDKLEREFERLDKAAQLEDAYDAVEKIDGWLTDLPFKLDGLRDRGYVHSGEIEERLELLDDQWDETRSKVERLLSQHVQSLDREADGAERHVSKLDTNPSLLKLADSSVSRLKERIDRAETAVSNLYKSLHTDLSKLEYRFKQVEKMLDLIEESPEIRLREAEGPVAATIAVWRQNGDEGPEGALILTDQRLIFEQREEVVTKRRFGLFKSESEMIQKVLLEEPTHAIDQVKEGEKGGFLGMGKKEILSLVFAAEAAVSRAEFTLKGQDSEDWMRFIRRIQSGEIDNDRADAYVEEVEEAAALVTSFPTTCPNCFAELPTPERGMLTLTCEFCGKVVQPEP